MNQVICQNIFRVSAAFALCLFSGALIFPLAIHAQLITFSKQDFVDYTAKEPFERFPDGRPKVPTELLERARDLNSEEIWATLHEKGYNNQFADGFQILHAGKPLVGRAFTVQFMPMRQDVDQVA